MSDVTVPLVSRRRERLKVLQKLQHGIPATVVFVEGLDRILTEAGDWNRWLGTVEAIASLFVLGAILRSIGRLRWGAGHLPPRQRVHVSQVDWVDIFLGLMLFIEVAARYVETEPHRWARPTIVTALATLAVGLLHGRLTTYAANRRALRVTESGVSVGGRFLTRFTAAWQEIDRIDISEKTATIVMRDGRTQAFDLIDIRHSNDVTRALNRARTRLDAATPSPGVATEVRT